MEQTIRENNLAVVYVPVNDLINPDYNPRTLSEQNTKELTESIKRYGIVDPLLVNSADERKNIVIGGNFRLKVIKELGFAEAPVVYIHIPDLDKEKELCLRLNKNQGEWDLELLSQFDETFLSELGFDSEELDSIFEDEETETIFDLEKELKKVGIENVTVKKGDVYDLDGSRLMCGDSTTEENMLTLCDSGKTPLGILRQGQEVLPD